MTSFTRRVFDDHRIGDRRIRRIADVDRVQHVAARAGAEVGVLAVLVDPHFFRAEARARQSSDQRQRPAHVALGERHGGFHASRSERRNHCVFAGLVAHERTVAVDGALPGRKAPRRREPGDRLARGVFAVTAKRSTSPVRASTFAGDTDNDASVPAATATGILALTAPTDAVIVAFPARTAAINPASVTVATVGSELFHSNAIGAFVTCRRERASRRAKALSGDELRRRGRHVYLRGGTRKRADLDDLEARSRIGKRRGDGHGQDGRRTRGHEAK